MLNTLHFPYFYVKHVFLYETCYFNYYFISYIAALNAYFYSQIFLFRNSIQYFRHFTYIIIKVPEEAKISFDIFCTKRLVLHHFHFVICKIIRKIRRGYGQASCTSYISYISYISCILENSGKNHIIGIYFSVIHIFHIFCCEYSYFSSIFPNECLTIAVFD